MRFESPVDGFGGALGYGCWGLEGLETSYLELVIRHNLATVLVVLLLQPKTIPNFIPYILQDKSILSFLHHRYSFSKLLYNLSCPYIFLCQTYTEPRISCTSTNK